MKDRRKKRISYQEFAVFAAIVSMMFGMAPHANAQVASLGQEIYDEVCAICHGEEGTGGGSFAPYLKYAPTDLTTIAKNNRGEFPFLKIYQIVDGRQGVRGHGKANEMPIWGDYFRRQHSAAGVPYSAELITRARLVALVDYIESIQQE